jgi:quinol monooxygenase YgiN
VIRVIAVITVKPGRREEVLAAVRGVVPAVRAERGCLEYGAVVDAEGFGAFQAKLGPDAYFVIETWESAEALKAHAIAPHMKAFGEKTKDLIASRAIHVLSPI